MKKLSLVLALSILSASLHAQTTTNLNLALPAYGSTNWNVPINGNSQIIDNVFSVGTCGDGSHALSYNSTTKTFGCQLLVSSVTGGTCTNQAVTAINTSGVPTCTTLTSAYVNNSIALTGTDINTSNQVTAAHITGGTVSTPAEFNATGNLVNSTAAHIVSLFSTCSGVQYLGADGACHSGSTGTVTSVTFTGDGTVLSSTPSSAVTTTGTVTASLATAAAGTVLGNATGSTAAPTYTAAPVLGVDNTTAGSVQTANGSSAAHTIWASAATTSNTIKGFATAPTTGHVVDCTVASTTCTLHDSGLVTASVLSASAPTNHGVLLGAGTQTAGVTSAGSSGQVLTSNGASSDPTFQAAAGGAMVQLCSLAASASSSLDFKAANCPNGVFSSSYHDYIIKVENLVPTTNAVNIHMLVSTDGGSTWATTLYDNISLRYVLSTSGFGGGTSQSSIQLDGTGDVDHMSNDAHYGLTATYTLYSPLSTTVYKRLSTGIISIFTSGSVNENSGMSAFYDSATAVTAFQILPTGGGTLASGTVTLYGITP